MTSSLVNAWIFAVSYRKVLGMHPCGSEDLRASAPGRQMTGPQLRLPPGLVQELPGLGVSAGV